MLKVILDTNFLLVPGQFKIDIFTELDRVLEEKYELIIPSDVIVELVRIISKGGSDAKAARIALILLAEKKIKIKETRAAGDRAFFELAASVKNPVIATLDATLRRKAKELGIKVIYLRSKKYLTLG